MTSAISCPLWSSVYECQRVECAFTSQVRMECGMFVMYCMQCLSCGGMGGVGGELLGSLDQGLEGWGGVRSVRVVSPDSLCRWQVQMSVYCAWRIPAHLRCTKCSILLHLMDICFLTCI